MTVRTRKTITDLIQQLKVQEKDIKSQLSDSQRRLNEVRDRISTCYWVIDQTCEQVEENNSTVYVDFEDEEYCDCSDCQAERLLEENPFFDDESRRLTWDDYNAWKKSYPELDTAALEKWLLLLGYLMPFDYLSSVPEDKQVKKTKVKSKKKTSEYRVVKKPYKLPKDSSKYMVVERPSKKGKK